MWGDFERLQTKKYIIVDITNRNKSHIHRIGVRCGGIPKT